MKELILASNNYHKVEEIQSILNGYRILTLKDIGYNEEIEETGTTFEENSLIKARTIAQRTGKDTIADDSGLCVELLGNEPGVYSARYSKSGTDEDNLQKVLRKLNGKESAAKYVCAISLVTSTGDEKTFYGECQGRIITEKRGDLGFGYDPIFHVEKLGKTFAEITSEEKNKLSHRRIALEKLAKYLNEK